MRKEIRIGDKLIGEGHPTFVIAELSGNHNMIYERAEAILREAKRVGADAIKLQTYRADTITIDANGEQFRTKSNGPWAGQTLYELYEKAYTPWEWQPRLKKIADELGIILFSSPFDETAVDFLEETGICAYKIASYEINDIGLIRRCAITGKPIFFSTGIANENDIDLAIQTCLDAGNDKIILLKCTSEYPAPYEHMNLLTIPYMKEKYDCIVGLSDHSLGDEVAIGAVALGATVIEKHLTMKRTDGGVDSDFSIEPEEMGSMIYKIHNIERALGKPIIDTEGSNNENKGRSLYVVKSIKKGELITKDNVKSIRPGYGLHTKYYEDVLGKKAARDLEYAKPLEWRDLE